MFTVTHFRTEFIYQGQATILRKVTMTQFLFVIVAVLLGVGLFGAPWWLAPLFMIVGYVAGISYHGELLVRRLTAYLHVRGRDVVGSPRIVNLQTEPAKSAQLAQARLPDPFGR